MNRQRLFGYLLAFAICLLAWKLASMFIASSILPSPEQTIRAFVDTAQTGAFWADFSISAYRVLISIALAWSIAFPLAILIGYNRRMDRYFSPLVFLTYPIPKMAFLPVIILLFGLGDPSKIVLITIIIFFQILVTTKEGVSGIDRKYIDSMRSMNASERDILREAVIPAALPSSFTALRLVTGTAISVLFFTESFAGSSGLGYMIVNAWTWGQYTQIYVGIIAMGILGIALYETFTFMERRMCRWKEAPEKVDEGASQGKPFAKVTTYAQMIKLSHTVFALPFGLAALVILGRDHAITFEMVFWVVLAIVGARSAAMGFNRVADAAIDAKNTRTMGRHIPSGALTVREGAAFIILSSFLFVGSAAMLSLTCFLLSFPVLAFLFAYSYTKRFTWGSHIVLGLSIGLMPLGASVAIGGGVSIDVLVLSLGLMMYIAGFDILYACQDIDFDRKEGLFSMPAHFGIDRALHISSTLHLLSLACLASLYWIVPLGDIYLLFVAVIMGLFIMEHRLVRPNDLSKVNVAFFNVNSIISVLVFVAVLFGVMYR
jgi:4-hydroxybenzoate polyprenyltransferase